MKFNQPDNQQILNAKLNKARKTLRDLMRDWNQHYGSFIDIAPSLDTIHLDGCQIVPDRYRLLDYLPKHAVVCEVGTDKGEFARCILNQTSPTELHIIDISFERFDHDTFQAVDIGQVSKTYEMDSYECLLTFPDHYFDWIYIDANHYYEAVKRDLAAAKTKVKENGYIVCNDYTSWSPSSMSKCGVAKAVNEFCIADYWKFVFFALQGNMYCDVALQRI
jgi:ubiquinone/menaquinone biosynthesis C-methylase UbiE